MNITATKVRAEELKPGELFSTAGPDYWARRDPLALGERVYIRTDAATPPDQAADEVYRITIGQPEVNVRRCPCGQMTINDCAGECGYAERRP